MAVKKLNPNISEKLSEKTEQTIYRINKHTKKIEYFVVKTERDEKPQFEKIIFEGFDKLPNGFYSEGYGITTGGYLISKKLHEEFTEPITLIISKNNPTKVKSIQNGTKICFNYKDFQQLQSRLKEIKKEKNKQSDNAAQFYLNRFFPETFEAPDEVDDSLYQENQFVDLLNKVDVDKNLSKNDIKALNSFYPKFLELASTKLSGEKRLYQITKTKNETEIIYLENVIEEFEKNIKKSLSENNWQEFLSKYILLFNTNYTDVIEKASISLISGKYPDFMLIDVYNYIDIYEIKKPQTNLLKLDTSRNNYYWDVEIAKAISQIENYVHLINKNSSNFREDIKVNKGIDVRVVKPRGFIIAGSSSQFKSNEKMENDFRLLNYSLKNVEIVLYDELLNNLKIFLNRLKSD